MYLTPTFSDRFSHTRMVGTLDLGKRLRDARTAAGVSAREMADALGLDPSIYSRTELGKRGLRAEELVLAAQRLDMPIDELVTGSDAASEARRAAVAAYGEAALALFGLAVALNRIAKYEAVDTDALIATTPRYTATVDVEREEALRHELDVLLRSALTFARPQ